MKPFNLEEAKAGKPVQTRDGRAARIICFDAQDIGNEKYIVALITNEGGFEVTSSYTLSGIYGNASNNDLVMKSEKKEGFVTLYRSASGLLSTSDVYTNESTMDFRKKHSNYVATVKIEWEE